MFPSLPFLLIMQFYVSSKQLFSLSLISSKFSCHPLSALLSLALWLSSRCPGVSLLRREAEADESDTASELLIDVLHQMHTTTPKDTQPQHTNGQTQEYQKISATPLHCKDKEREKVKPSSPTPLTT